MEARVSTIASTTLDGRALILHVQAVLLGNSKQTPGQALVRIAAQIQSLQWRAPQAFNAGVTPGSLVRTVVLARVVP